MEQNSSSLILISAAPYFVAVLAFLVFVEQIKYLKKKSLAPGPQIVLPFIGNVVPLIRQPTRFWELQSAYAACSPLGVSVNYILGRFILFIRDTELSHKVFTNVRPDAFHLIGHPFGKKLFGNHNMIYMFGDEHRDLRRRIAVNFTPRAVSTYTAIQQRMINNHIASWLNLSSATDGDSKLKPLKMRFLLRDLNLETSQTVFAGPYLSQQEREKFSADYALFNTGVMKLPIDLPGFAFRNTKLATSRMLDALTVCAARSKERMIMGGEPKCFIDVWMQDTVREEKEAAERGDPSPPHSSNREIACHMFDFLFAAQDASTASLIWAVTLIEQHPDVLDKVRAEVSRIWSPRPNAMITFEQLQEMKYTHAVAREVLRYRTPATLVTHVAAVDFPLTEKYTIPKGTVVFPSVFESSFQGFTDPGRFDPERFLEGKEPEHVNRRNFMAFGAGPHQCPAQRYAMNYLVLFIAMFVSLVDFNRHVMDGCDDITYVPTVERS